MENHFQAWDRDYGNRGRLWGGSAKELPEMPEGSRILELGCGNGKTLFSIYGNKRIVGLDVSMQALHLCKSVPFHSHAYLIQGDARKLPFQDNCYDFVLAFHITGHLLIDGRIEMAHEAARVLVHGGKLFFRDFGAEDMRAGHGQERETNSFQRANGILTHYFAEDEAKKLFSDLVPQQMHTRIWKMRVKGRDLRRAEIEAVFIKP